MNAPVTVQGVGIRTALGQDEVSTLLALRSGCSAFAEHPRWVDQYGDHMVLARIGGMDSCQSLEQRLSRLSIDCALSALSGISRQWLKASKHALRIYLALPTVQTGVPASLISRVGEQLADALNDSGWPIEGVVPVIADQAGGLIAMEEGMAYLMGNDMPFCLVGGVDSWIEIERLEWLDTLDLLHSRHQPRGFIPGEAGGFCLLSRITPGQQDTNPSTELLAVGHKREIFRPYTEDTPTGNALAGICQRVLSALPDAVRIEDIHADLNGERWRAAEWGMASLKLGHWLERSDHFSQMATGLGDIGAATGPVLLAVALASAKKGFAEGDHALVWVASANGLRAAATLHVPLQQAWLRDIT